MVKSRTLHFPRASPLSIALENEKGRPAAASWSAKRAYQRISVVPALVTTTGLPALMTWVDWAVWL